MNDITTLIYLADVAGSVGITFTIILVMLVGVNIVGWGLVFLMHEDDDRWKTMRNMFSRFSTRTLLLALVLFALNTVIPSQDSVHAMILAKRAEGMKSSPALDRWLVQSLKDTAK